MLSHSLTQCFSNATNITYTVQLQHIHGFLCCSFFSHFQGTSYIILGTFQFSRQMRNHLVKKKEREEDKIKISKVITGNPWECACLGTLVECLARKCNHVFGRLVSKKHVFSFLFIFI